jgi:hypothetical protein
VGFGPCSSTTCKLTHRLSRLSNVMLPSSWSIVVGCFVSQVPSHRRWSHLEVPYYNLYGNH